MAAVSRSRQLGEVEQQLRGRNILQPQTFNLQQESRCGLGNSRKCFQLRTPELGFPLEPGTPLQRLHIHVGLEFQALTRVLYHDVSTLNKIDSLRTTQTGWDFHPELAFTLPSSSCRNMFRSVPFGRQATCSTRNRVDCRFGNFLIRPIRSSAPTISRLQVLDLSRYSGHSWKCR